jgi:hypothetical protein
MHLLAQHDLDVLGSANAHFTPEILDFIRNEPVKGNCYFWSAPDQPYVVSVRVDNYDSATDAGVQVAVGPERSIAPPSYDKRLERSLLAAICNESRVFVYRVAAVDDRAVEGVLAVSPAYLAMGLPEADELQGLRPGDWEERGDSVALIESVLASVLTRMGLSYDPPTAFALVEGRPNRRMQLLSGAALAKRIAQAGLVAKPTRAEIRAETRRP